MNWRNLEGLHDEGDNEQAGHQNVTVSEETPQ